jgi:hypothetical protein
MGGPGFAGGPGFMGGPGFAGGPQPGGPGFVPGNIPPPPPPPPPQDNAYNQGPQTPAPVQFSEVLTATTGNDALVGGSGNTSFSMAKSVLGGTDTVDGGAGTDQLTFTDVSNLTFAFDVTTTGGNYGLTISGDRTASITATSVERVFFQTPGGSAEEFALDAVGKVRVAYGSSGNDTIDLSLADPVPTVGTMIKGMGGNDTITGSSIGDMIFGGDGADTITGGGGVDVISLNETAQAVDIVKFTDANHYGDQVLGFNFVSGNGGDQISFGALGSGIGAAFEDAGGDNAWHIQAGTQGQADLSANDIFVLTTSINDGQMDANTVATAIGTVTAGTATAGDAQNDALFIVNGNGSSALWAYTNGNGANANNTTVQANELTLVATFQGVTINAADADLFATS